MLRGTRVEIFYMRIYSKSFVAVVKIHIFCTMTNVVIFVFLQINSYDYENYHYSSDAHENLVFSVSAALFRFRAIATSTVDFFGRLAGIVFHAVNSIALK